MPPKWSMIARFLLLRHVFAIQRVMTDVLTKEQRRRLMQSIRRENTEPEEYLRQVLKSLKIKFKQHPQNLPGKPDFYFPRCGTVLFVHGCFWHGHAGCNKGRTPPKSNSEYWRSKVERNQRRDRRVARQLRGLGLSVFTLWACNLRKRSLPARLVTRIS